MLHCVFRSSQTNFFFEKSKMYSKLSTRQHESPFNYYFDVPSISTINADLASASLVSLPASPRKVVLLDRSRYYTIRVEKKPPEVHNTQQETHYYARLRLGLVEPELAMAEAELVKAWALSHRGERIIELKPNEEGEEEEKEKVSEGSVTPGEGVSTPTEASTPSPQKEAGVKRRRALSYKKKKGKKGKMRSRKKKEKRQVYSKKEQQKESSAQEPTSKENASSESSSLSGSTSTSKSTSMTSLASTSSTTSNSVSSLDMVKSMKEIAHNLEHSAYSNQCIVMLDFVDSPTTTATSGYVEQQEINFQLNCVSSQFPSAVRGKLALILEIFAYDTTFESKNALGRTTSGILVGNGQEQRRVDMVSYPLFIFWPGGADRRMTADKDASGSGSGSLLKIKDEKLEALHNSLQVFGPYRLPTYYWDLLPGRGLFTGILEVPKVVSTSPVVTYLDKGTSYLLRLKSLNFVPASEGAAIRYPAKLRSTVSLRLKGEGVSVAQEAEQLTNWSLMNGSGGEGASRGIQRSSMLEIDYSKCAFSSDPPVVVLDVTRYGSSILPGNSFTILWSTIGFRPPKEVKLAFKINVTSAEFFGAIGTGNEKSPFSLTVDTFNDSFEGQSKQIDSISSQVVVLPGPPGNSTSKQMADDLAKLNNVENGSGSEKVSSLHSCSVTLLRTAEEFTVKSMLFISFDEENNYRPLFLFQLEVAYFHQEMTALVRKAAPKFLPKIEYFIGVISIVGIPLHPPSNITSSGPLTNELMGQLAKNTYKGLFKCVPLYYPDDPAKRFQVDLKLLVQSAGLSD